MTTVRHGIGLALGLIVALGGCGDGGNGDDARATPTGPPATAVTAMPSATATALANPTPLPTGSPFPEALLACGRRFHHATFNETPLVLRNEGSGWREVSIDASVQTVLNGVVFSTPDVAWAFGFFEDQTRPVLWRSSDAGRTWTDVTMHLPAACHGIRALAFADAATGYLVSHEVLGPFAPFATHDGGTTWLPVARDFPGVGVGTFALGMRGTAAEAVRYDSSGLSVARLDDVDAAPVVLAPSGGTAISGSNAFATFGLTGWIGASAPTDLEFPPFRATILTSAMSGVPWTQQPVEQSGWTQLTSVDVRDSEDGVAGGFRIASLVDTIDGFALVMQADGRAWETAPITGLPPGYEVDDVLRTRGEGAWAIAVDVVTGIDASAFLRSEDNGRSWQHVATEFEHDVQLVDLARNTAVH